MRFYKRAYCEDKNNAFLVAGREHNRSSVVLSFTYVAQELDHAVRTVDAQQDDLVAEQDLQGHKHQDLTGAADHLVPHPKHNQMALSGLRCILHSHKEAGCQICSLQHLRRAMTLSPHALVHKVKTFSMLELPCGAGFH